MKTILLFVSLVAMGACVVDDGEIGREHIGSSTGALIGGILDSDDPAVVGLRSGGGIFCTGTLVSPSVVLTAGHCVDDFVGGNAPSVIFGSGLNDVDKPVQARTSVTHPSWTGNRTLGDGNDLGLLLLLAPQDPLLPLQLNATTLDATFVDTDYRHVGFGTHLKTGPNSFENDGRKRQGTASIAAVYGESENPRNTIITADDTLRVCFGDSGGPGLITIDSVEYVAGVHSYTSDNCTSAGGDTRVDANLASFIQPYIDDNDPACGADGLCALIGCTADPDCDICGAADGKCVVCQDGDPDCPNLNTGEKCSQDEQCNGGQCTLYLEDLATQFCTETCVSDDTCPDDMHCEVGICYFNEPPPGSLGYACAGPDDCSTGICENGACTKECDLSVGLFCPNGFECASANQVDYYCQASPSEGGGCNTSGQHSSTGLVLTALLLLGAQRRRRWQRG